MYFMKENKWFYYYNIVVGRITLLVVRITNMSTSYYKEYGQPGSICAHYIMCLLSHSKKKKRDYIFCYMHFFILFLSFSLPLSIGI